MSARDHHSAQAQRAEALERILEEKGLVSSQRIDELVAEYEAQVGPLNGARLVARAWVDADFKGRLLADGRAALAEFDFGEAEMQALEVVENTEAVHNVVVCTLCSCYPWAVLGLPPAWYKSPAYRSRIVREPRAVLAEMGLSLAEDVELRVWDSSAEVRYLVLPRRPPSTAGMDEEALSGLITRDAMIGVAEVSVR